MMHTPKQSRRTCGISLAQVVREIATYLRGWLGYFGDCQTPSVLQSLGGRPIVPPIQIGRAALTAACAILAVQFATHSGE